jgi:uncharacterized protein YegP (UPF0339 family)
MLMDPFRGGPSAWQLRDRVAGSIVTRLKKRFAASKRIPMTGTFILFTDDDENVRFRLTAADGSVLVLSPPFTTKQAAVHSINQVREHAAAGHIEDQCPKAPSPQLNQDRLPDRHPVMRGRPRDAWTDPRPQPAGSRESPTRTGTHEPDSGKNRN